MRSTFHNRPSHNGSSNSTVEILIALVVVGAGALTALALAPRARRRDDGTDPATPEHEEDDERGNGA